jgi:hypothetical protein
MVTHEDFMDAIVEVQAKKKANLNYYAWINRPLFCHFTLIRWEPFDRIFKSTISYI